MRFLSLFILITLLIITGCEEEPTAVGGNLVPPGDLIITDTLDSYTGQITQRSYSRITDELDYTSANRDLVGRYRDNFSETEFALAMRLYTGMDSVDYQFLEDSTLEVISAKFILKPKYNFGSNDELFDISVHPIEKNWNLAESLTSSDLDTLLNKDVNLKISHITEFEDSLLTFELNTEIIKEWIYEIILDSTIENKGALFVPTGGTSKIIGFNSLNYNDMPRILVEITKNGEPDSLIFSPGSAVAIQHIITERTLTADNTNLLVQGGVPVKSFIYFDFSSLSSEYILNKAELELTVDTLKFVETSDPLTKYFLDALVDSNNLSGDLSETIPYSRLSKEGNIVKGNITGTLQGQLSEKNNQGYLISAIGEESTVSRDVFYPSNHPDKSKRPRLIIYYTKKN